MSYTSVIIRDQISIRVLISCPVAKLHKDTSWELDWSSEFFFLMDGQTRHIQFQASVMHSYTSTCCLIGVIQFFLTAL